MEDKIAKGTGLIFPLEQSEKFGIEVKNLSDVLE